MDEIQKEIEGIKRRIKKLGLSQNQFSKLAGYVYPGCFRAFLVGLYKPGAQAYIDNRAMIESTLRKMEAES
jgi:hypothetical protein